MFIDNLHAAGEVTSKVAGAQNMIIQILPFIFIFVVFYLLLIRPQKKRQALLNKAVSELKKGDAILTVGGVVGRIYDISDDEFVIETGSNNTQITVKRASVSSVLPSSQVTNK